MPGFWSKVKKFFSNVWGGVKKAFNWMVPKAKTLVQTAAPIIQQIAPPKYQQAIQQVLDRTNQRLDIATQFTDQNGGIRIGTSKLLPALLMKRLGGGGT
ncbi:hypothetical protein FACS189472_11110 [Alphaproteobacteria bacterium]|nr:hypothetical protein FACS189472_11110 [Alphaproteobacteria bacterium]